MYCRNEIIAVIEAGGITTSGSNEPLADLLSRASMLPADGAPAAETGSGDAAQASQADLLGSQLAPQVVFELLDVLHQWLQNLEYKDAVRRHMEERDRFERPNENPPDASGSAEESSSRVALRTLLDVIPKRTLAHAAYRCRAFTRALRYLELHLRNEREKHLRVKQAEAKAVLSSSHLGVTQSPCDDHFNLDYLHSHSL